MQLLTKVAVLVLLGLSTVIGPIYADSDLLELSCDNSYYQCKLFEDSQKKIVTSCVNSTCVCTKDNVTVECVPNPAMLNNIITGPCPCPMLNSECRNGICYCESESIPSADMRQCIYKYISLGHTCEFDEQCQSEHVFSVCNKTVGPSKRVCNCRDGFIHQQQRCLSIISETEDCDKCLENESAECSETSKHCICKPTWIGSEQSKKCLNPAGYGLKCELDVQCQHEMGIGAVCHQQNKTKQGSCGCKAPYIEEKVETNVFKRNYTTVECDPEAGSNETNVESGVATQFNRPMAAGDELHYSKYNKTIKTDEHWEKVLKVVCVKPPVIGDYCYDDKDCVHPGLKHMFESLHCFKGACQCRQGYVYKLNHHCAVRSGFKPHGPHLGFVYLGIAIRILKALFC